MKTHKHHIIPHHMGGPDTPENLIELTIEEHAEAHRVLWERYGLIQDKLAWLMLSGKTEAAEAARIELVRTPEHRAKMSAIMKGKVKSPTHCANLSRALRGKSPSAETRAKMARAKIGNKFHFGKEHSEAARQKMSAAWKRRTPMRRDANGRFLKNHEKKISG